MQPKTRTRLKTGSALLALCITTVGAYEGLRTVAYRDVVGIPTVCFGETRGVKMGDRYSVEECRAMLGEGLKEFEAGMRRCLINPDALPDKPYAAMLSITYNIGAGSPGGNKGFCASSMARKINAGDIRGACNSLLLYNRAGGRVIRGLTVRRQDERALCLEGVG